MEFLKDFYAFNRTLQYQRVGDTLIMLLMVGCYYYIYRGKNDLIKKAVIFPSTFYAVLVLNPFSSYILNYKLGFDGRMYRLLWIFPVFLIIAYTIVDLLGKSCSIQRKIYLAIFFIIITFVTQNDDIISYNTENIYKVQNELITVTRLLHEIEPNDDIVVFFEDENLYSTLRQYDPSIGQGQGWHKMRDLVDSLIKSASEENFLVFFECIENEKINYVISYKETEIFDERGELEFVAETKKNKIYRIR